MTGADRSGGPRARRLPLLGLAAATLACLGLSSAVVRVVAHGDDVEAALCGVVASVSLRPELCAAPAPVAERLDAEVYGPPVCRVYALADERGLSVRSEAATTRAGDVLVEESSDGAVRVVATAPRDGAPGSRLGDLPDGRSARPDGPGRPLVVGDSWTFASRADWESFRAQLDSHTTDQAHLRAPAAAGEAWWMARSASYVPAPPAPAATFVRVPVGLGQAAALGVDAGARGGSRAREAVLDAGRAAGVTVESSASGTQTWTYALAGDGPDEPELGALAVTRDGVGDVVEVVLRSLDEDGRVRRVTTTTLPVDERSREDVDAWLAGRLRGGALEVPVASLVVAVPASQAFPELLYRGSTSSVVTYSGVRDADGFARAVADGWALGLAVRAQDVGARSAEAAYLGSPSRTGERLMIPEDECTGGASF